MNQPSPGAIGHEKYAKAPDAAGNAVAEWCCSLHAVHGVRLSGVVVVCWDAGTPDTGPCGVRL